MTKLKFIILFISILIIVSCSTSKETTNKIEKKVEVENIDNYSPLDIKVEKNVCWLNLMPGADPKFHVSGKLSLLKSESYDNNNMFMQYIKVYQAGEEIYFIKPKVRDEFISSVKKISYSTIRGLTVNEKLNTAKPITIEFFFSDGDNSFTYTTRNITVEEVH